MTQTPSRELAEAGFAKLGPVLDPFDVARILEQLSAIETGTPSAYGMIVHNTWLDVPAMEELLKGRLARIACACMGVAEVVLFQDLLIAKMPGTQEDLAWHQDFAFWPLDSPYGLTMWIALDDADADNGCLRYIPGTHRPARTSDSAVFGEEAWQRSHPRSVESIDAPCPSGHGLVHDPLLWHMSPANRTTRARRAWSISWLTPEVRWSPERAAHPFNHSLHPMSGARVLGDLFPRLPA